MRTVTGRPDGTETVVPAVPRTSEPIVYDVEFPSLFDGAYRVAFRILGNRDDAADIANDTMAKAWLRWDAIVTYAPAWVARSSANAALTQIRRRRLFDRLPLTAPQPAIPVGEQREDLVRALRRLSSRQRDVLVLRYIADLPEAEVAEALGCSVGTVKQHAHRGLRALRSDADLNEGR
jgi:RNA polymerase sigma factor (sigma-70 family)